jgi:CBS domain-containing protein
MRIADLCNRHVATCERSASAADVARLMREHHAGEVVVVDTIGGIQMPVGLLTDRDLVVEVMGAGIDPESVTAGDLMPETLVTVYESEDVQDAIWHMHTKAIRRLPVVDYTNRLRGTVALDDIAAFLASALSDLARIAPRQRTIEKARRSEGTATTSSA